jgi:diguanylate cyclase (GGDEF)-like protein
MVPDPANSRKPEPRHFVKTDLGSLQEGLPSATKTRLDPLYIFPKHPDSRVKAPEDRTMPELKAHRLDPVLPLRSTSSEPAAPWVARAAVWLRSTAERVALAVEGEPVVDRFAGLSASAREPEEVRVELVRLAWEISGASKVELFCDRDGRVARRLACWPTSIPNETTTESSSSPRGPIAGPAGRTIKERPTSLVLQLPLKAGDSSYGTLRLTAKGRHPWPARVVRRLATLCAIASAAERGLARPSRRGDADPSFDPTRGTHGSTILSAFLSFAHAQARRRHESLSLMEVAVDRLDSIRELLGDELADAAIERVSRAIQATVRASDVVARLEEGRIAVLLPNASDENAMKIAESIRASIARAGAASTTMPSLTASIGVATYPDHAHDIATLRAAASSTLTRAREQGHDRIATAPPIPSITSTGLAAHRVG